MAVTTIAATATTPVMRVRTVLSVIPVNSFVCCRRKWAWE
jgi:hypothetical protein